MDDLKIKTPQELRAMLKELGVKVGRGNHTQATLMKMVKKSRGKFEIDQSPSGVTGVPLGEETQVERQDALQGIGIVTPPVPIQKNTSGCSEEEVTNAVKNYAARGMTVKFFDNCWEFRFKDRVDSGTMSQPVYNIVKAAEAVCRESVPASRMFLKG